MNTRKSIGLLALLAALLAFAVGATTASATIVVPPATAITAESKEALFVPENEYSALYVKCTKSVAEFTTPAGRPKGGTTRVGNDLNVNRTAIGTKSTGSGGVTVNFTKPPSFSGCGVFNGAKEETGATVETNETNGKWTLAANGITTEAGDGALGVPKAGAVIKTALGNITVSPTESSAVFAPEYKNSAHTLKVDSQIDFSTGVFTPPAGFEATYTANNLFEILP